MEAVKKCADMASISINVGQAKKVNKHQDLYDIYELSQKFYQNNINMAIYISPFHIFVVFYSYLLL